MAINIFTKYTSAKVAPPTIDMPYGLFRNVVVNADGTGTPMEAEWLNDWYGFLQALLVDAELSPNGIKDNANSSQYLDAIKNVATNKLIESSSLKFPTFADMGEGRLVGGKVLTLNQITNLYDIGQTLNTIVHNNTSKAGGASYKILTTAEKNTSDYVGTEGYACIEIILNAVPTGYWACLVVSSHIYGVQLGMRFDYNGTTGTDDTIALQATIDLANVTGAIAKLDIGRTLITDSLSCPTGTKIQGVKEEPYDDGFGVNPKGTIIEFQPTATKKLFVADGATNGGFRLHYSIKDLFIRGGANADIALDLNGVIYGRFTNLAINNFNEGIRCTATINNNFNNVLINDCSIACVAYQGSNETTDVWEHCTFFRSDVGTLFRGSSLAVRFNNCLFEQLNRGAQIAKECQSIMYSNCYAEDVVYDANPVNSMFEVGLVGTTAVLENNLIITGGKYAGRNVGNSGSFISADDCKGIIVTGVNVSRFTNGIKTTANTRDNSIIVNGMATKGVNNRITDLSKVVGLYPHSNVEDVGAQSRVRAPVMLCQEIRQDTTFGIQCAKTGEKLGFYGVTPVAQPSSSGETAGFTAGAGVTATSASTATGNLGTTAYRHSDIVKALKQVGILAL